MQPKYYDMSVSIILQEAHRKPNGLITRNLIKGKISESWLSGANFQIIIKNKWKCFLIL